jgi:hypothetical protein
LGLLEKVREQDYEETLDEETAHDVLVHLEESIDFISPTRVIFASIAALLILTATLVALVWIVPYEKVNVDVVYRQGGPGHIVLVELDNRGSRMIEDIHIDIRFLDSDGIEIGRTSFDKQQLAAHTSIAGDELELLITGESVWENYSIEILLNYGYYDGNIDVRWTHDVGQWTMETFSDNTEYHFL